MSIEETDFNLIDYEAFQILKKWETNSIKIKLNISIKYLNIKKNALYFIR